MSRAIFKLESERMRSTVSLLDTVKIQYNPRSFIRAIMEGTLDPALLDQRLLATDSECSARPLLREARWYPSARF